MAANLIVSSFLTFENCLQNCSGWYQALAAHAGESLPEMNSHRSQEPGQVHWASSAILFTLALILSRGVIKNKRQSLVTTSPAEAEYQAARLKGAIPCLSYTDSPVNHPCPTTEACQSNDRMPSWFLS